MTAVKDLIHETSATTGTGNLTTAAVNGKNRFGDSTNGFGTGSTTDVFDYFISNREAAEWERGTGHCSALGTLVRDTVKASSNSGSLVSFSAGVKDVFNDIPAGQQWRTVKSQVFTSSGTYTPSTGMLYCIIRCVGGGAGGGGAGSTTSAQVAAGGGGGAGAFGVLYATAAQIGASQTVTIGAKGTGGSAGNNAGNNGAQTSIGSLLTAGGGLAGGGGGAGNVCTTGAGGAGGAAGTGTEANAGPAGDNGFGIYNGSFNVAKGGIGGSSSFGAGGKGGIVNTGQAAGSAANGYGSGGGGAASGNGTSAAGGDGTDGVVVITEFCAQ